MATGKKYYWIKLKSTFLTSEKVDFLMSQPNGTNYVVIYQMLCLKTINSNGELCSKIGELIIPYDIEKIQRDLKYFDIDTIRVALELYKNLGMIYTQENGILKIAEFEELVGTETDYAKQKRIQRSVDNDMDNGVDNVHIEYRDKRLEYRDKSIDIKSIEKEKETAHKFAPPTLEEVEAYCKERNNGISADTFINFYESKGWMVGKNKMKDWKACVRTWEAKQSGNPRPTFNQPLEYSKEPRPSSNTQLGEYHWSTAEPMSKEEVAKEMERIRKEINEKNKQ